MDETPSVARISCPTCEPEADPLVEILDIRYCDKHTQDRSGDLDKVAEATNIMLPSGSAEAGGAANRLWCNLLHRRKE